MHIGEFITPERIGYRLGAASKKRALESVSGLIASGDDALVQTEIFDCLVARECLGSTGLGHGIAIPHGRLKGLKHITGAFVRLERSVDFDTVDGEPVDIICALVVPPEAAEAHLHVLASLASLFSRAEVRACLRRAASASELYAVLTEQAAEPLKHAAPYH